MTYQQTLNWLFEQVPNYQLQGGQAYKPGLHNIKELLKRTGNPEKGLRFVHIAGTNGKGSVSHMLASIFISCGYKTGLFTSPHLKDFRERIKIDGKPVSEDFVVQFCSQNRNDWEEIKPSFFEITTVMAFEAFSRNNCEICIIETGLGGRLDSTNVIVPELSVITNIGLDHVEFLGDTLEKIAYEKAGIIKPKIPVVIGEHNKETSPVFEEVAEKNGSEIIFAREVGDDFQTDLKASYQRKNVNVVVAAIETLRNQSFELPDARVRYGLQHIAEITHFQGRFQQIGSEPDIILDAAHNEHGVRVLMKEIASRSYRKLFLIYGAASDKDIRSIFQLFPREAQFLLTEFNSKRSARMEQLELIGRELSLEFLCFKDSKQALERALGVAGPQDLIVIFGSFYLIQEFLPE